VGKREDNKLAKELEMESINGIKERLKGSGWKKKHNSFSAKLMIIFYAFPLILTLSLRIQLLQCSWESGARLNLWV